MAVPPTLLGSRLEKSFSLRPRATLSCRKLRASATPGGPVARSQAEFENARKRAVREQDFRDYALMDALKTLLPVVDSFERALHASAGERSEFRNGSNSSISSCRMPSPS